MVELKIQKGKKDEGVSVHRAKKNITITLEGGVPVLELTNEYGNSAKYEVSDSSFDSLFSNLWQFVKDSQH